MAERKNIELRSEEVQEVLGAVPVWILRWGTTTIFVFVVVILIGSWIFKYPDTISATMTLTGEMPPAGIVAKTNGRIKELYIKDNQQVKAKEYLAVLENPASTNDMLLLKNNLEKLIQTADYFMDFHKQELKLGTAQSVYASFIRSLDSYQKLVELNYYPQKIAVVEERILQYKQQYQNFELQQTIAEQQYFIAENLFKRDSLLYLQKVIPQEEMEKSEKDYLQNRSSFENSRTTLKTLQIQISQLKESLLDIEQQYADNKNILESELNTLASQLLNEINIWEINFVLISSIDGKITFVGYWSETQNVTAGETVFSVIPTQESNWIGKAQLPVMRSGKVEKGQMVNIHFMNYPDNEFGMVKGKVSNISLVPINGYYIIDISFPNGLLTTYKKILPFSQEMTANIEIITEDMRLIERFIMPLKRLWKEKT
jgi:HlyD family secretion protein